MKPPIIADNFGDLLIFNTIESAQGYLEPIDVRSNEYVVYDSEGRLLRALASSDSGPVTIEDAEKVPTHQTALRGALISFLSQVGERREDLVQRPLHELVSLGLKYPTG